MAKKPSSKALVQKELTRGFKHKLRKRELSDSRMTDKKLPLTRAGPVKASTLTSRGLGQPGLHSTVRGTGEKFMQGN